MVRPRHECERGCAVLVEHIYVFFLSLYRCPVLSLNLSSETICLSRSKKWLLVHSTRNSKQVDTSKKLRLVHSNPGILVQLIREVIYFMLITKPNEHPDTKFALQMGRLAVIMDLQFPRQHYLCDLDSKQSPTSLSLVFALFLLLLLLL